MPLLARMVASPLFIDVRAGAVAELGTLLAQQWVSTSGRVAIAVGPGQGEAILEAVRPGLGAADAFIVSGGSVEAATKLIGAIGGTSYDALIGIGGGRTLDVTKFAATRLGLPMVAVATNLSHDGICSPVSSLETEGGRKGSFGVAMPLAVVVDLDYVRSGPVEMVRSGVGDAISNLSAIADWELAARERDEPIDGLAVTFSRTAAECVLHRRDRLDGDDFLTSLAEALVLSGMAMAVAGTSRPCSGSDHEILHAVDQLFPGTASHGDLAGVGALFATWLRGDESRLAQIDGCLRHYGLPRRPVDLGLTDEQFAEAVVFAPTTRPDRYTILEHTNLDLDQARKAVTAFAAALDA